MRRILQCACLTGMVLLPLGCNDSSSSHSSPVTTNTNRNSASAVAAKPRVLDPLISGEVSYVKGVFVWTDYAYDDRGSNSDSIPGGDASYPEPPHPGNTADLIQLQLSSPASGGLQVNLILQTLVEGYEVVAGIGLDTDNDTETGAASLPGEAWSNDVPLGLEQLVVLNSNGAGELQQYRNDEWQTVAVFSVEVDREENRLTATIDALQPGEATWNAVAALGPADADSHWLNGGGDIFDLAFVRGEDPVTDPAFALQEQVPQVQRPWQDKIQADILAGQADAGAAIASITFGGKESDYPVVGEGLHTFMYRSPLNLEEGVRPDPLQYRGLFQPYVVMIPEGLPPEPPAVIFMHGADQNHLVNAVHFSTEGTVIPGFYNVPAVVVFPMGRDPNWNTGLSEQDLLDVTDDAIARLNLDAERIVLSGISAGGIGTFRHAARYPDRWTGGYSIVGGGTKNLGNLRNLPLRAHNGLLDPLVNVQYWQDSADALALTDGVDYRTVLVHTTSHLPSPLGNCWYLDMLATPRNKNPARVTYALDPADYFVDPEAGLDLRPRSAYWVLELISQDDQVASIDVTSLARPDRATTSTDIDQYGSSLTGADFCGPNPDSVGNDTWQELGRAQSVEPDLPTDNAMELVLSNMALARLDVVRMALTTDESMSINTDSDAPSTLELVGDWSPSTRVFDGDGDRMGSELDEGVLRFAIQSGQQHYTVK